METLSGYLQTCSPREDTYKKPDAARRAYLQALSGYMGLQENFSKCPPQQAKPQPVLDMRASSVSKRRR